MHALNIYIYTIISNYIYIYIGTVPVSAVASTKKIKSLVGTNHQLLAQALHASLKLVSLIIYTVDGDGLRI